MAVKGSGGVKDPDASLVQKLKELHPGPSDPVPPLPFITAIPGQVTNKLLKCAARKIANGTSADIFGWTGELIRELIRDSRCRNPIKHLIEYIRSGVIENDSRNAILVSWLIGLDKGKGKIRPIAGGCMEFKLAATYCMEENGKTITSILSKDNVQFGVMIPEGVTLASRITQLALEANPDHVALAIDFKNAFNLLNRKMMMEELYSYPELANLFPIIHWSHSCPTPLFIKSGMRGIVAVIYSCEGVRQGCVFGAFCFCIAMLSLFVSCQVTLPLGKVVGIMDDLTVVADFDHVISTFDKLVIHGRGKIQVQNEKCVLYSSSCLPKVKMDALTTRRIAIENECLPILGTVVGRDPNSMIKWVGKKFDSWIDSLQILRSNIIPSQLALLLMRWEGTSKIQYLCRSLPPSIMSTFARKMDLAIIEVMERKLNIHVTNEFSRNMIRFPFWLGGLGLANAELISPFAHFSSFANTLPIIKKKFAKDDIQSLYQGSSFREVCNMIPFLQTLLPKDSTFLPIDTNHFLNDFSGPKALQHCLVHEHYVLSWEAVYERETEMNKAHLMCRRNPYSSSIFKVGPLTTELSLDNDELRFAVSLAASIPLIALPQSCSCGQPLTIDHTLSCMKTGGKSALMRHNMLQMRVLHFSREGTIPVGAQVREKIIYDDDEEEKAKVKREDEPDLTFYWGDIPNCETDITVVNPKAKTYYKNSAYRDKSSIKLKENRKRETYEDHAKRRNHTFMPLVIETHGDMGDDFLTLLKQISDRSRTSGYTYKEMIADLQFTLVRGNAIFSRKVIGRSVKSLEYEKIEAKFGRGGHSALNLCEPIDISRMRRGSMPNLRLTDVN
jgi:hypothetical protein